MTLEKLIIEQQRLLSNVPSDDVYDVVWIAQAEQVISDFESFLNSNTELYKIAEENTYKLSSFLDEM